MVHVKQNLQHFDKQLQNDFLENSRKVYNRAISYIKSHFNFDNNVFESFKCLNLDENLNFDNLSKIINSLNVQLDIDSLFDEIVLFNNCLNSDDIKKANMNPIERYCKIFSTVELPHLSKTIGSVMAIPVGNEFVERIFSQMHRIWTEDRNSLSIDLIKAEICIKNNFDLKCSEFKNYIKSNKKLLKAAQSQQKYDFK
jgi:hypothetical protein